MADKPIIFSGGMVRALLDGRKTQTRRVLKLPTKGEYVRHDMGGWAPTTIGGGGVFTIERDGTRTLAQERVAIWNQTTGTCIETPLQIGDRLWVREAHAIEVLDEYAWYRLDHPEANGYGPRVDVRWRPSIHMPRWASRLTLIVESVRVEHLHDISDEDAVAEGLWYCDDGPGAGFWFGDSEGTLKHVWGDGSVECYARLWDHLHGLGSWDENPWICALTFRVIKANIDAVKETEAALS